MMDTASIHLTILRNSDYIQYMRDYLHVFENNDPSALGVQELFDALAETIDDIEEVFGSIRYSALTGVIARLDAARDRHLAGIAYIIKGYLRHDDPAIVQAAKKLDRRLRVYGTVTSITRQNLQGETATLDNLTEDLQQEPALVAAAASLGLSDWIQTLKATNDTLESTNQQRSKERGQANKDKIKTLRIRGNGLYHQLRERLAARALIADYAPPYNTVIKGTNAVTEQYNQLLAVRRGAGSGAEDYGNDDPEAGNG